MQVVGERVEDITRDEILTHIRLFLENNPDYNRHGVSVADGIVTFEFSNKPFPRSIETFTDANGIVWSREVQ